MAGKHKLRILLNGQSMIIMKSFSLKIHEKSRGNKILVGKKIIFQ